MARGDAAQTEQHRLRPSAHALCSSRFQWQRRGSVWIETYPYAMVSVKSEIQANHRIDILNRCPSSDSISQTVHVMRYIFPRQFRLHNVFTSVTDNRQTVQRFKDYTMREEILQSSQMRVDGEQKESIWVPKRLRGKAVRLVRMLQDRNKRCPYVELLKYYCPSEVRETRACSFKYVSQC